MKIETPLIAVLFGSLIFAGLLGFFFNIATEYNVDTDLSDYTSEGGNQQFQNAFNQVNATKEEIDTISEEFKDTTVEDTGSLFPFLSLALKVSKLLLNSINLVKDMLISFSAIIGIDPIITTTLISAVIIVLIISILILLLGRANY